MRALALHRNETRQLGYHAEMRAHSAVFVLASACSFLPDEVSVSTFTNEYDYLGGDDLKGLGSQDGTSTGVAVTATYKLKPQQVQLVPYSAPVPRPPSNFADDLTDGLKDGVKDGLAQAKDAALADAKQFVKDAIPVDAVSNALPKSVADATKQAAEQAADSFAKSIFDRASWLIYALAAALLFPLFLWWLNRQKQT